MRQGLLEAPRTLRAVDGVSLQVRQGEIVSLIGANGAGKSTLLKAVAGLLRPQAGRIAFNGTDLAGASCTALGFVSGPLGCSFDCLGFDVSRCESAPRCGDGVVNQPGELCDSTDLNGLSCTALGLGGGALQCAADCNLDTRQCTETTSVVDNKGREFFVGFLPTTGQIRFTPSLAVNGVGLRVGKSSGPLLDMGLTLESIALHVFARIALGKLGLISDVTLSSFLVMMIAILSSIALYLVVQWTGRGKFLFERPAWAHIPGTKGSRSYQPATVPAE